MEYPSLGKSLAQRRQESHHGQALAQQLGVFAPLRELFFFFSIFETGPLPK
jgi:hypothetical protein